MTGTVSRVNIDRGFGFIEPRNGGVDVFFHLRALAPDLPFDEQLTGRRVEFETEESQKGPRATSVRGAA